jgi:hypothetical protein
MLTKKSKVMFITPAIGPFQVVLGLPEDISVVVLN